jgi:hypothetical protein
LYFGFVSDFEFRISHFQPGADWELIGSLMHGKQIEDRQGAAEAEVLHPGGTTVPDLRAAAGGVPEVWNLSHLLS